MEFWQRGQFTLEQIWKQKSNARSQQACFKLEKQKQIVLTDLWSHNRDATKQFYNISTEIREIFFQFQQQAAAV